jgi:hypothetical protein
MGWRPGQPIPNPPFVRVSRALFDEFYTEWNAINRRFPHFEGEPGVHDILRRAARKSLREELKRSVAMGGYGDYIITV